MAGYQSPTRIVGVDFSAASRDAGRNTWIAEGRGGGGLRIEALADAASCLECDPDRASTIDALANWVTEQVDEPAAFGLDFPFGLPESLLEDEEDWHEFVEGTADGRWGALGDIEDPMELYDRARFHAEDRGEELRRTTDEKHGGQEPTGYRIKTQTYYGISGLLAEIADDVSVPPMDDPDGRPLVLETYPACTLEGLDGAVRTGYKRDTRDAIDARRRNVAALERAGVDFGRYHEYAVASDHALDAVAAAYATFRATRTVDALEATDEGAGREGYIYGGGAFDPDEER